MSRLQVDGRSHSTRSTGERSPSPVAPGQIARFGASVASMPPIVAYEGTDGVPVIYNGVTRATRIAKLAPGVFVRVEVIGRLRRAYSPEPKLGDQLS